MDKCILCKSSKKDDIQYGEFLKNKSFGVHTFCLYLSSNLSQNGQDDEGFLGFLEADIKKEVKRIYLLKCFYCNKRSANIGCCERRCRHAFHLICGLENNAVNQFHDDFRSYCHRHVRRERKRPSFEETCLICFENIYSTDKKFENVNMILTPCCCNGWFHKLCLQKFAKTAGYFFKCPLCNDSETFLKKLPSKGIFIPKQDAAWELEPNAFADLLERPNECAAQPCNNRMGRKESSERNPLILCCTCGSIAMHRKCLNNDGKQFHCADCTLAIEEADSGHESLNLIANREAHEDVYVDVCDVSDKEDFEIIERLFATNSKISEDKRDSGDGDSSDEDVIPTTRNINRNKRVTSEEIISISDTSSEIAVEPVTSQYRLCLRSRVKRSESSPPRSKCTYRKTRTKCEAKSSADILGNEQINPRKRYFSSDSEDCKSKCKVKRRKCKPLNYIEDSSENENDDNINTSPLVLKNQKFESTQLTSTKHEFENRFSSVEVISEETINMPPKVRQLDDETSICDEIIYNDLQNISTITIESDKSDDPLEWGSTYIESQKNKRNEDFKANEYNYKENLCRKEKEMDFEMECNKRGSSEYHQNLSEKENIKDFIEHGHTNLKTLRFGTKQVLDKNQGEETAILCRKRNELNAIINSQTELMSPKLQRLHGEKYIDVQNISIITIDDDSFECFTNFIESPKNMSSTALKSKKSKHLNKHEDFTVNGNKNNEASLCRKEVVEIDLTKQSNKKRDLKYSHSSSKKQNNFNISYIANRTRRKSVSHTGNKKSEQKEKDNPINTSYIALRTRRKTICC